MPRTARNLADNCVYHLLNRGNCRMKIFTKTGDFAAFVRLVEQARRRFPTVRILGYCLMNNHWHLVVWPEVAADLSRFMAWLCTTHVRRWRAHRGNAGEGHVYQGRFKSFMTQNDSHLLSVLRYVEGNPLRAGIVERAEKWPWSSLTNTPGVKGVRIALSDWPMDRPKGWRKLVNAQLDEGTLGQIRTSVKRSRPFGDEKWTRRTARRLGLEWTLRDPWRPRKVTGK